MLSECFLGIHDVQTDFIVLYLLLKSVLLRNNLLLYVNLPVVFLDLNRVGLQTSNGQSLDVRFILHNLVVMQLLLIVLGLGECLLFRLLVFLLYSLKQSIKLSL